MSPVRVATRPFPGQKPGTSGLRKPVAVFREPGYLENFVQAIFNATGGGEGRSLVLGGDGRFFNREAVQRILRMAAANGVRRVILGRGGLLSTPAASCLIRKYATDGGIILSASHNPGGPEGDFGIKFNGDNGGPATESVTGRIYIATQEIDHYLTLDTAQTVDIDREGPQHLGGMHIEVVDPVADYADLLATQFDFAAIGKLLANPRFHMCFDAMHAVTGPYAREILEQRLGAAVGTVINATPLEDFGGHHPDPNLAHAAELVARMNGDAPLAFGAASDGDGDRNMVLASGLFINPCDSLAIMAANAHRIPAFAGGLPGVARSMPTSRAVDRVAAALDIPCYETPTGWKFFGNLLDAGRIRLCGEESFGTGADHVREKDGLWAVLFWLNLIAELQRPARSILREHWLRFGRDYFTRHDYERVDSGAADALVEDLRARLPALPGQVFGGLTVASADEFAYTDPVTGETSVGQGLRVQFSNGGRAVLRLSGTGTAGATLRVYLDSYQRDPALLDMQPQKALAPLITAVEALVDIRGRLQREGPDVVT
ncbi:MAG: alpha-D-glucose phosphate-specific phosphoglucomutase [Haliea sp.]|nr:alpha-D-glucose phosphate-specific phosphoglucomutase [Haliea sp.]